MPTRRDFLLSSLAMLAASRLSLASVTQSETFNVRPGQGVMINFEGMIALAMGDPNRISAGILNACGHSPRIAITRIGSNGETDIPSPDLTGSLFIDLLGATPNGATPNGATPNKFHGGSLARQDVHDLRWGLSMNELYPNAGPLTIRESGLSGKVHVNGGTWFTSELSEFKWRFFSANGAELPFNRQVGLTSCWFDLQEGQSLRLTAGNQVVNLDYGASYRIDITNLPTDPSTASIEHFLHYYSIIEQPLPQYVPVMAARAAYPTPILCSPGIFDQSTISSNP